MRPSGITEGAFSGNRVIMSEEIMQICGQSRHRLDSARNAEHTYEQNFVTNMDG